MSSGGVGFNSGEVIRTKLQTGVDLNGNGTNDGSVDVNWGSGWQLDPNVPAVDPDYDFFAALVHEFTPVSYLHLLAHETLLETVFRFLP